METTSDHQETFAGPDIDSAITEFAESLVPSEVTPESLMLAAASDDPNEREWAKKELESLLRIKKKKDKYGLNWSTEGMTNRFGKERSLEALETGLPYFTRRADLDVEGAEPNMDRPHILIEGDNLHALTVLRGTHTNKVDLIYIDPPYNTGKEFTYNDNFIDPEHPYRHSAWLDFMWRRLKVARELLAETGVVMISIDDNEQANLKLLCDEVFGERNFIECLVWEKKYTVASDARFVSNRHEYVLVYARSRDSLTVGLLPRTEKQNADYKNRDNDPRGPWKSTPVHARSGSAGSIYTITFPNGVTWTPPVGTFPMYSEQKLLDLFNDGRIYFGKTGKGVPAKKTYLSEVQQGVRLGSLLNWEDFGTTQSGSDLLRETLGRGNFDYPKSETLLRRLFGVFAPKDAVILDFFAGSGTTGHAVAALNAEDGGTRQCIMVTLDESGICQDVTRKRMEAVLTGKWADNKTRDALPGSLIFYQANGMAELPEFAGSQSDWYVDMNAVAGHHLAECAFISESGWMPISCSNANLRAAKTAQGEVVAVWLHSFVSIGMLDALKELSDGGVIYVSPKALRNAGGRDILRAAGWETRDYAADFASRINSARETAIQSIGM